MLETMPPLAWSDGVHASTWRGEEEALLYERGRPEYPESCRDLLTEQLGLAPGTWVADLAAGTGKLTRLLTATGAEVVAVEPMPGMRHQLGLQAPSARIVAARAERLPLRASALDVVTVAQAFHWFSVRPASAEIRRVLRPGGRLAIVTNRRHSPHPWLKEMWDVLARYERLAPRPTSTHGWRHLLETGGDFTDFTRFELPNEQRFATLEDFDARFTSISFVILLEPALRAALLADLHAAVAGVDPLVVPLRTEVEIATRRG